MAPDPTLRRPEPLAVDLDLLLAPIPGEDPAGEWLRYSGVYDEIQEARREDDPALPQGVWKTPLKRADWRRVAEVASGALTARSKDLQLAVWLLEAWLYQHGIAGVAQGVSLVAALCEGWWEGLHPRIETVEGDEDFDLRLAPLQWLDERLSEKVRFVPVTCPDAADVPLYSLADAEEARRREHIARTAGAAAGPAGDGGASLPAFLMSVTLTPSPFYAAALDDVHFAIARAEALAALLAERCGQRAPTLRRLREHLAAIGQFAERVLTERAERGEEVFPPAELPAGFAGCDELALLAGDPIRSRAEAYRRLAEAADYLLRTEPHSPAPYLVLRAVAWGGLTLPELLAELMSDRSDLATVYALLGLREGAKS